MHATRAVRAGVARLVAILRRMPRGQSLVELAIVLPVLLLLVGGAVDLGRLFSAQVAISNAAKEGAFFGATSPRCDEPKAGCVDPRTVSWHVEEEVAGVDPLTYTVECLSGGSPVSVEVCAEDDMYRVTVEHHFALVTPILSAIFGNGIDLRSTANAVVFNEAFDPNATPFPLPSSSTAPTPSPGTCVVPDFVGTRANDADDTWDAAGFSGSVTEDGNGNFTISSQSLAAGSTQSCGTGITVSEAPPSPTPAVTPAPTPTQPGATPTPTPFPSPTPSCSVVPNLVGMTVGQARSAWTAAGFTGSFTPANGQTNKTVTNQVTNPASAPGQCIAPTASVTVTYQ